MKHMAALDRQLKKGSTELLVLSLVERRARHGYEIAKLIEARSEGALRFNVASLSSERSISSGALDCMR